MKQQDFDIFCMSTAYNVAKHSYAKRRKVGAVIAKDGNILSFGYNGTPSGFDNNCEDFMCVRPEEVSNTYCDKFYCDCTKCDYARYRTREDVVHAEENAIAKMAKSTASCENASMYITCAPCARCSRLILQSGIKTVYYSEEYHTTDGIEILKKGGIKVIYLNMNYINIKL